MPTPLVSIITPAFKASKTLNETANSVLAQTFQDWELIIVDDASPDNTVAVAESLASKDPRIRVLKTSSNSGGPWGPRKLAIQNARGRYLAFLDADDLWLPEKLEKQIAFMEMKKAAISFHSYRWFTNESDMNAFPLIGVPAALSYSELLKRNVMGCLTVMIDTSLAGKPEPINHQLDDFFMWLDVLRKGHKAYGLNSDLARYRVGHSSLSKNKVKAAAVMWDAYTKVLGLTIWQAAYNFFFYAFGNALKHTRKR